MIELKHKRGEPVVVGSRVQRLVVKEIIPLDSTGFFNSVLCDCDCGNSITLPISKIKFNQAGSCGCSSRNETHGMSRTPIYSVWREMNKRCFNNNDCNYEKYGAKGISVCDGWHRDIDGGVNGFINFYNWAIKNGYKAGLTLDRINPYEDYNSDNCRWVDYEMQNTHLIISNKNTSGYMGVSWTTRDNGWRSRIKVNKTCYELGVYNNKKEALDARNEYIIQNNLPHKIQKYIGEDGYTKDNYDDVFEKLNIFDNCKKCGNLFSSFECDACENFDMYIESKL